MSATIAKLPDDHLSRHPSFCVDNRHNNRHDLPACGNVVSYRRGT